MPTAAVRLVAELARRGGGESQAPGGEAMVLHTAGLCVPEWLALSWVLTARTWPCGIKPGCQAPDQPVWGSRRCGHSY